MAAEAEAAREARAKVIAAEGEQKASRALREASEVIGDSPAALQLRYLQVTSVALLSLFLNIDLRIRTMGMITRLMPIVVIFLPLITLLKNHRVYSSPSYIIDV